MRIRREHLSIDREYLIARNAWARDGRLSLRARGLLMLLLSHKAGWNITLATLVRENPEGRDAIRAAIGELEECGYLRREQSREGSKFGAMQYTIGEPAEQTVSGVGKPDTGGNTASGSAGRGKSGRGKSAPKKTKEEDQQEEDQGSTYAADAAACAAAPNPKMTTPGHEQPSERREDVEALCALLADRVQANGSKRPEVTARWRDAARALLDEDDRTPEQAAWIIRWAQDHPWWRSRTRQMDSIRRNFDTMRDQSREEPALPLAAAAPTYPEPALPAGPRCEDHPTEPARTCRSCRADVLTGDRPPDMIGRALAAPAELQPGHAA